MADAVHVPGSAPSKFKPHPAGTFAAQCVDTIALGARVKNYKDEEPYLAQTAAIVFRTGAINDETGEMVDMDAEFTISMHERAALRQFLENWRGATYTAEQAALGIDLEKLLGQWAFISVEQKPSRNQRIYGKIKSIMPLPKEMPRPAFPTYARVDRWALKKADYAKEAAAFLEKVRAETDLPTDNGSFTDAPRTGMLTNDDLPF